jgi:hypothetical protein
VGNLFARFAGPFQRSRGTRTPVSHRSELQSQVYNNSQTCLINDDSAPLNATTRAWITSIIQIFIEPPHPRSLQISTYLKDASTISEFADKLTGLLADPTSQIGENAIPSDIRSKIENFLNERAGNAVAYHDRAFFWPDPTDAANGRSLYNELPFVARNKFITKQTPIVSVGSCFAFEIAKFLQENGFNYVVTERDDGAAYAKSSARWGIIFNTPSFRQLVERAFGYITLPRIVWSQFQPSHGKEVFFDPFREDVIHESLEGYEKDYDQHVAAARDALTQMRVLIITLGLNEVWRFKMDGSVFSRSPWRMAPSLIERRIPTIAENVQELERMREIIRLHNPDCKIIVTLSPIPLHATFVRDKHIVEANTLSKAALRLAADEFCQGKSDVFYLPSYELIASGSENAWMDDQRHVKPEAVRRVMDMFVEMFVSED